MTSVAQAMQMTVKDQKRWYVACMAWNIRAVVILKIPIIQRARFGM